jgi:hypothetical protein
MRAGPVGLTFIKFRLQQGGFKAEVRDLTNWQQQRQSNLHSRIRALNGAAYCGATLGPYSGPHQARGGTELAPLFPRRLTWAQRHKIDVNEE